jgi:hypothetical protein
LVFISAFFLPFAIISDYFYSFLKQWLVSSWVVGSSSVLQWSYISFSFIIGLLISLSSLVYTFVKSSNRYKKITWIIVSLLVLTIIQFFSVKFLFNIDYPLFFNLAIPFSILLSNAVLNSKYPWLIDSYLSLMILGRILVEYVF